MGGVTDGGGGLETLSERCETLHVSGRDDDPFNNRTCVNVHDLCMPHGVEERLC